MNPLSSSHRNPSCAAYPWNSWAMPAGAPRVRHVTPGDTPLVARLLASISPQSYYARFFTTRSASAAETTYLAGQICGRSRSHITLLATLGGQGSETAIGLAECVRIDQTPATGEIALLVDDAYQSHGIGTILFAWLMQYAMLNHIATLRGIALGENRRVLHGLHRFQLNATTAVHQGEVWIEIGLEQPAGGRTSV